MSNRLETLRKRFIDAKADADASKREVRQASAAKLAELRALQDPAAQLAGLKDPALLPSDRQVLEHALADVLPRRRIPSINALFDTPLAIDIVSTDLPIDRHLIGVLQGKITEVGSVIEVLR